MDDIELILESPDEIVLELSPGAAGAVGLPAGGYQGQVLVKSTSNDFETEWASSIDAGEFM